jgi:hypothetical protein
MIKLTAVLDDYCSLDGHSTHRTVTVKTEHEQVHIKTNDGRDITISRRVLRKIVELINV